MDDRTAETVRELLQRVASVSVSFALIRNNPAEVKKRIADAKKALNEAERLL